MESVLLRQFKGYLLKLWWGMLQRQGPPACSNNWHVDSLIVERCGLLRISGWSQSRSADIPTPRVIAHGADVPLLHRYRYARNDVQSERPLAGVAFEYHIPAVTTQLSVNLDIGGVQQVDLKHRLNIPDYAAIWGERRVLKRHDIYGSGPPAREINDDVRRLMQLMRGRILDFGCGSGALVAALRAAGKEAIGLELDRDIIKASLLGHAAPYITFYDAGAVPFADDHFDCVTAFEVLEHIEDYQAALRELARLAPVAILSVPDIGVLPLCHSHQVVPWHLLESTHVNFFTEASLAAALSQHYSHVEFGRVGFVRLNDTSFHVSLLAICRR
jgi:SAM-dependent methyltransferase